MTLAEGLELSEMPQRVANRLIARPMKRISARWPVWHPRRIRNLRKRRHGITDACEKSISHLVCCADGRFLETTADAGLADGPDGEIGGIVEGGPFAAVRAFEIEDEDGGCNGMLSWRDRRVCRSTSAISVSQ